MKMNKFLSVIPAACLLLGAAAVPSAGAVDVKNVTSGAVVEIYSGDKVTYTAQLGSAAEAWSQAVSKANSSAEAVITMGSDWVEDELLTVKENQRITIDLNGHYIKRSRNHETIRNGEVFLIEKKGILTLRDSNPRVKGYDGVRGGVITGGASGNTGGGVHINEDGEFRMQGGTIYDCITDQDGGGVYVDGWSMNTKFTMTGGRIYGCKTIDSADECFGGAIYLHKGVVDISNAKLDDNYSEDDGGAIYSERGTITLNNVIFSGNRCHERGGAIYTALDTAKYQATLLHAYDCIFAGNHADEDGGALFIDDNPEKDEAMLFHNCKFRNNTSGEDGGAAYINDDNIAFSSCEIVGNKAGKVGGGVYVDGRYNITLMGLMIIRDNTSDEGAGVANLALQKQTLGTARIINGGLHKDSEVHVGSTSDSSVLLSEWMSQYQMQYFKADKGTLTFKEQRTVDATMITSGSVFSNGGFYAVVILGTAGVIGAVCLIIYKKKKNKEIADGEEND